ncbi:50S ribosomal protein L30 [Flavobacterium azooxidireducens]|jgi:large subunit ribosomal protein L30|uniref:Large ribosomal subunit protein uL30 n=2 Tax=Flavobacterium TaxID=237 RepID=A0A328WPC2_9FLAO|nr:MULTISPECIES: 50S ribosomal protein L30 [Flavobacterium]RAR47006.1 LSU ribosomal protein L30P [Flavobacterium lacus]UPQ77959.1 50S ribosomal protein L30 [Flavobacterium azooxidireducens]
MSKILVKQVKSQINCPLTQKRTLVSLGLKRLGQVVEHENSSAILGMVNKVKHLVSVEETK